MKRYKLLLFAAFVLLPGCKTNIDIQPDVNDDLIEVSISLSGDLSISEESLTKSPNATDYLVGIQVYQDGVPYAYGLFNAVNKYSINLHTGREYNFKSQAVKRSNMIASPGTTVYYGSGQWWSADNSYSSCSSRSYSYYSPTKQFYTGPGEYGEPFSLVKEGQYCSGYLNYSSKKSSNGTTHYYFYDEVKGRATILTSLSQFFCYSDSDEMNISSSYACANDVLHLSRYYGESPTYLAKEGEQNDINIELKHLVYGLKCNVIGVTDGSASFTIKNASTTLLEKTDISSEYHSDDMIFAVSDMHSAWQYSDNYTENVSISMTWMRGVGILQDLGTQIVQVKRNCMNVITVSLSATKADNAFIIQSESYDME